MTGAAGRPLLLLDVDGVLNQYGTAGCPPGYTEHDLFPADDEPVRVNIRHGAWIRELSAVFDLAWATGWNDLANELLAPLLGIPDLPVVPMPATPFVPGDKVPAVAAYAGTRPVVWFDDLHTPAGRDWSARRPAPTLLIDVDPTTGLTREAVDRALRWAAALPA